MLKKKVDLKVSTMLKNTLILKNYRQYLDTRIIILTLYYSCPYMGIESLIN